jgi:hypothetical protein
MVDPDESGTIRAMRDKAGM